MPAMAINNQVRIIAGQWRGRKLNFPDSPGLRPTSDRIRETLFNWLAPVLPGAVCLDLFAGSGALGFEAASRGAAHVVMSDRDTRVLQFLRDNCKRLAAEQIEVRAGAARDCLANPGHRFDIVFLDPPFTQPELLVASVEALSGNGCLSTDAYIYVERAASAPNTAVPDDWAPLKSKCSGAVEYRLYRRR